MAKSKVAAPKPPTFKFADRVKVNRDIPGSCPPAPDNNVYRVVAIDYEQGLALVLGKFNTRDTFEFVNTELLKPAE